MPGAGAATSAPLLAGDGVGPGYKALLCRGAVMAPRPGEVHSHGVSDSCDFQRDLCGTQHRWRLY